MKISLGMSFRTSPKIQGPCVTLNAAQMNTKTYHHQNHARKATEPTKRKAAEPLILKVCRLIEIEIRVLQLRRVSEKGMRIGAKGGGMDGDRGGVDGGSRGVDGGILALDDRPTSAGIN